MVEYWLPDATKCPNHGISPTYDLSLKWVVYLWFLLISSNRLSNYLYRYLYMCYWRFDCLYRKFPFDRNLIRYAFYRTYFGHLSSTGKNIPILFNFYIFDLGCRNRKLFGLGRSYWWFWFTKERENGERKNFGPTFCKEKGNQGSEDGPEHRWW